MTTGIDTIAATILSLERGAAERWNKGDVEGPLELYADNVSYFDPITATRLDGRQAVAEYFRSLWAGKVRIARYEVVNPQVITGGKLAVLTYNQVNYVRAEDDSENVGARWNSTQVYRLIDGQWRVVHVHWSFTNHPAFANTSPEDAEGLST